jgi:glycosyltransferase involved in cell wall biosynthesis
MTTNSDAQSINTFEAVPVLHIVDSLDFGGTQTILRNLFESQTENQSIFLLALRETDRQIRIHHPNVQVFPSPSRFSLRPIEYILNLVKVHQIQILHCHLFRSEIFGYLAARLLRAHKIKLVFHDHGSAIAMASASKFQRFAFCFFQILAAPRVDLHVVISQFVQKSLAALTFQRMRNSVVLYNPIKSTGYREHIEPEHRAQLKEYWGIPQESFVLGIASRIVQRKGWRDFLVAVSLLKEEFSLFYLVAGDGPDFDCLQSEIVSKNLSKLGRVLGYVENLADFYSVLDCFVMPSVWEPAGLSHLEAQYFAVPIVACDVPGLNETVRNLTNCLLCQPNDPKDMSDKIRLLLTSPDLRVRIGCAGKENARRYTIENYIHQIEHQYASLLDDSQGT